MHTLTITDNDPAPEVSFTAAGQTALETDGSITITAQLSTPSGVDVSLPFQVSGTATAGTGVDDDYTITASPILIPAGASSHNITITLVSDTLHELNETVIVTMETPANATPGSIREHTATIQSANPPPKVSFNPTAMSGTENGGEITVTAQLNFASSLDVSVPLTVSGAAKNGLDYAISPSSLFFPAGATTLTVGVTPVDDALDEGSETLIITMDQPLNGDVMPGADACTVTITDNDPLPRVSLSPPSFAAGEDVGEILITATLSAESGRDVTIPYTLSNGMTNGSDFSITASPIIIPEGATSGTIVLTIIDDPNDEPEEELVLTLGSLVNADPGDVTEFTANVGDNDPPPNVHFTLATQTANEAGGAMTVTAELSAASANDVTVYFIIAGTAEGEGVDYSITQSPIVIPAGEFSQDITITIVNDEADEDDETVVLTMGEPTNASKGITTIHQATIIDDEEGPEVNFALASSQTSSEEETPVIDIIVELTKQSNRDITIPFTLSGTATDKSDYTITESPLVIAAGLTFGTIQVNLIDDLFDEEDDTLIVTLLSPTNASLGDVTVHQVLITDADEDTDNVSTSEESGPDQDNPEYDGNADGVPDNSQSNVVSLHSYARDKYITLAAPEGVSFDYVRAVDNPDPTNAPVKTLFLFGFFEFALTEAPTGEDVPVTMYLHEIVPLHDYWKYGPTAANPVKHWYEFLYNSETGAVIMTDQIVLHFLDGGRGDDDLVEDEVIIDIGGPATPLEAVVPFTATSVYSNVNSTITTEGAEHFFLGTTPPADAQNVESDWVRMFSGSDAAIQMNIGVPTRFPDLASYEIKVWGEFTTPFNEEFYIFKRTDGGFFITEKSGTLASNYYKNPVFHSDSRNSPTWNDETPLDVTYYSGPFPTGRIDMYAGFLLQTLVDSEIQVVYAGSLFCYSPASTFVTINGQQPPYEITTLGTVIVSPTDTIRIDFRIRDKPSPSDFEVGIMVTYDNPYGGYAQAYVNTDHGLSLTDMERNLWSTLPALYFGTAAEGHELTEDLTLYEGPLPPGKFSFYTTFDWWFTDSPGSKHITYDMGSIVIE
ncbi:MAG: hypothetical protein GY859_03780, partial [Desulfobacterales bacterium]|nr:hypothetical protein [Desulfobacterales bacterium]